MPCSGSLQAGCKKILDIYEERLTGRPLWYIIGNTDFYGYRIKVDERVLIPRPETEVLVREAVASLREGDSVLDLCTGSGAIAIAVSAEASKDKTVTVTAADISEEALELARENARKAKIHNKNLRDCRVHYNSKHSRAGETTLFITEGISASGSITTARDAETQAVFSLRGKPLNSFGMSRKVVYENEEFNFLQHALNIENGLEELRYDKVVIATDADDDGMHIRILLMTFFIQFFPELIREGHLFILQTPLFRVRNKQQTIYCYSDAEREEAISLLGKNPEITRFKGLGEISPQEFKAFIGEGMRLDRVRLEDSHKVKDLLSFYMGKNTRERQEYILNNLRVELDPVMD